VVPEANADWLLPRIVGLPAALDLVLTGRTLLGREAAELGLCHQALPAGEVLDAATRWVAQVAADGAPWSDLRPAVCRTCYWLVLLAGRIVYIVVSSK
jgi:enoyl-CoA hydratase/carnithine racemase